MWPSGPGSARLRMGWEGRNPGLLLHFLRPAAPTPASPFPERRPRLGPSFPSSFRVQWPPRRAAGSCGERRERRSRGRDSRSHRCSGRRASPRRRRTWGAWPFVLSARACHPSRIVAARVPRLPRRRPGDAWRCSRSRQRRSRRPASPFTCRSTAPSWPLRSVEVPPWSPWSSRTSPSRSSTARPLCSASTSAAECASPLSPATPRGCSGSSDRRRSTSSPPPSAPGPRVPSYVYQPGADTPRRFRLPPSPSFFAQSLSRSPRRGPRSNSSGSLPPFPLSLSLSPFPSPAFAR